MNGVFVIILCSSVLSCRTSEESEMAYKDLVTKTVEIFRGCFFSQPRDTLLLAGAYEEFLGLSEPPVAVALLDQSERTAFDLYTLTKHSFFIYSEYSFSRLVRKVEHVVVIGRSQPSIRLLLQRIKDSTWSNGDGFYILIDRYTERRGCVNAEPYLRAAWEYDLTFAVFFCIDPEKDLALYTYNPYSEKSPRIWEEVRRFPGRRGHPWILLRRKYLAGKEVCKELSFDKTAFVDGYEIRVNGINIEPLLTIDLSKEGDLKFSGDNGEVTKIVASRLNASLYVVIYNGTSYDLGGISQNGTIVGMLADISNGVIDMGMNTRPLFIMWKLRYTYPHAEGGMCVITQPSGYVSEVKKVLGFISLEASLLVYLIILVIFVALTMHAGPIEAALNIVRLTTAVTMVKLPSRNSSRIVLTMGMLMYIIISGVFQGHWSALLTVSVSYPNIETLSDLKRSNFTIYGPKVLERLLGDAELDRRFHPVSYNECKEHVQNSKSAACMGDCLHLYQRIRKDQLHHSKKIQPLVQVYVAREDWPLFARVNQMIQRMVQAGIVTMWRRQSVRQIFRERRARRLGKKKGYKVLKLSQLAFTFDILFIGYAMALLAFLVELAIPKYQEKRKKWMSQVEIIATK